MMGIHRYLQPWVFALVGGLLILGSFSLSGMFEYNKQLKLERVRNEIATISSDIESSRFYYLSATIKSDLGYIQNTVDKIDKSKTEQQIAFLHANHIKTGIYHLYTAIKKAPSKEQSDNIEELISKTNSGDIEAHMSLQNFANQLTSQYISYTSELWNRRLEKERLANELTRESSNIRTSSVIFQLLGLVILLFKELPSSLWPNKKALNEMHNNPINSDP